ncbi:hypothetical protein [Ruegeria lacuscaerulensis]|uniref:hypothetical protein n=1 Tax=Ruegeria lacuscaerulensis TaxID=55218 RepID=UPI00147B7B6D|nr:hypothetical protein [Ruegeria lacuscaerulensis]
MTSNTGVWYSRVMVDSTLIKPFTSEQALNDLPAAGAGSKNNKAGIAQPRDAFSDVIFGIYRDQKLKAQPDIFNGPYGLVVSRAVADVFREADLGKTQLYPLKLCQHDRVTPVEGEYFTLALGEQKTVFVPEQSKGIEALGNTPEIWIHLGNKPNDFDYFVSSDALGGPDLWTDPQLHRSLFLSDRLVKALRAAKLTRRFGLSKCKVISA